MSPLDRLPPVPEDADLYPVLAITALRKHSVARLRVGLIATALALTDEDPRDIMVNMAVPYHVAQQLGLPTADVFDEAASYARPEAAEVLRTFGRRTDVTLEAFGWRLIDTPDGPDVTRS